MKASFFKFCKGVVKAPEYLKFSKYTVPNNVPGNIVTRGKWLGRAIKDLRSKQTGFDLSWKVLDPAHFMFYAHADYS